MKKRLLHLWVILLILFLLAFATLIGTQNIDRFYISSGQLLTNALFLDENKHWIERGGGQINYSLGAVTITNNKLESTNVTQQIKLKDSGFYRLTFEGTTKAVSKGGGFADLATVAVIYRDKQGNFLSNQAAFRLYGTNAKQTFTLDMYIPKKVHNLGISVRLLKSIGTLRVSNLVLTKTEEFNSYKLFRCSIIIATTLALLTFITILAHALKFHSIIYIIFLIGAISLGTLLPENLISAPAKFLAEYLPKYFLQTSHSLLSPYYDAKNLTSGGPTVSKLGHAATFFTLGLTTIAIKIRCGTSLAAALIIYIALTTEALQTFSLLRTANIVDFYIDSIFGLTGLLIGIFISSYGRLLAK